MAAALGAAPYVMDWGGGLIWAALAARPVLAAGHATLMRAPVSVRRSEKNFTLDGSDPTAQSPAYTDPLRLTAATTVRARAILNNFPVTEILTGLFQRVPAGLGNLSSILSRRQENLVLAGIADGFIFLFYSVLEFQQGPTRRRLQAVPCCGQGIAFLAWTNRRAQVNHDVSGQRRAGRSPLHELE